MQDFYDENSIITKAQYGDSDAENKLLIAYSALVKTIARSYFVIGVDSDDLVQSGMIGLLNAVRNYNVQDGAASFKTYASTCIHNTIKTAIKKHMSVSSDDAPLAEALDIADETDLEKAFLEEEDGRLLLDAISSVLNERERNVLKLFLKAMSYQEISEKLGIEKKQVDNTIYAVRKKIKKMLDTNSD